MIDIQQDSMIYIFCPPDAVSGGPEALHQLQYYMREIGVVSKIVYYFSHKTVCTDRYKIYNPYVVDYKEVEDTEKNIVIVPETATQFLRYFKHARKCIWWLSVDNYFVSKKNSSHFKDAIKYVLNAFKKNGDKYLYSSSIKLSSIKYHFCGSQYAYDYLSNQHNEIKPFMLVEPISKDFYTFDAITNVHSKDRDNVILYNPAKPSEIMDKLLLRSDLQFKALRGYTPTELSDIYRHAKLYIDFGAFPGPERIPKESVYNGTCLLVGKRNASENDFDIPIPDFYKIEDCTNEALVVERIKYILQNYDKCVSDFNSFRMKVARLETTFVDNIKSIFIND